MRPGEKLKELRLKAKYSQVEFAKLCGIEQTYLSKLERGAVTISKEMALTCGRILKRKPWEIMFADYEG